MKNIIPMLTTLCLILLSSANVSGQGYGWKDHAFPFDFLFGNHFDTHQQSMVNNGEKLIGFFYIKYTGEQTNEGVAVAVHPNGSEGAEEILVGWILHGIPIEAMFINHQHGQHPTWYVDPADLPREREYSHFHWLGSSGHGKQLVPGEFYQGYLLKLTAVRTFYFRHHGGFLVTPGIDIETHANVISFLP